MFGISLSRFRHPGHILWSHTCYMSVTCPGLNTSRWNPASGVELILAILAGSFPNGWGKVEVLDDWSSWGGINGACSSCTHTMQLITSKSKTGMVSSVRAFSVKCFLVGCNPGSW